MVWMDATNFGGGAVFLEDEKKQVVIRSVVGLDKVNEGDERR